MTFYTPSIKSGHAIHEQGALARHEMLTKSYADYEREIVDQMTDMSAASVFDAERDIAGIVLNRWRRWNYSNRRVRQRITVELRSHQELANEKFRLELFLCKFQHQALIHKINPCR